MTRNVAGTDADVTQILPANADPHEYEPTPSDAEALADADLVVRSGDEVDGWLDQLIDASGSDAPVLTLSDHVRLIAGDEGTDPHWWQDPRNAVLAVAAIRDELDRIDPGAARSFDANARRYTAEIERLDRSIAACIDRVPAGRRKLVTSHDALGYYADRYGIEVDRGGDPGAEHPGAGVRRRDRRPRRADPLGGSWRDLPRGRGQPRPRGGDRRRGGRPDRRPALGGHARARGRRRLDLPRLAAREHHRDRRRARGNRVPAAVNRAAAQEAAAHCGQVPRRITS